MSIFVENDFWYREEDKENARVYWREGRMPPWIRSMKRKDRYERKWKGLGIVMSVEGEEVWMKGKRRIVFVEEVEEYVVKCYHSLKYGFKGRDGMYEMIRRGCIGVSVRKINEILKNIEIHLLFYQDHRLKISLRKKRIERRDEEWQADLIYMKYGGEKRIVLCVVDVFSRYVWCRFVKNATKGEVVGRMREIIGESGRRPS